MIFGASIGKRYETPTSNLGTSLATILANPGSIVHVESINFCNKTNATVTVSLCKTSGGTDYYYLHTFDIEAYSPYTFKDHAIVLTRGQSLRALAGTGTAIDVSVVAFQANG